MLSPRAARLLALPLARAYSTPVREVIVSQSRDLARNTALEDWAVRNIDLKTKNLLILTNNLSLSPGQQTVLDVRATLLDVDAAEKAADFEKLVFSALPPSFLLSALPEVGQQQEPGAVSHSVRLPLAPDTKAKEVLEALNIIARAFLGDQRGLQRLSLVRPDDGWFPGLEEVRVELEGTMKSSSRELAKREVPEEREGLRRGRKKGLQNSYGH